MKTNLLFAGLCTLAIAAFTSCEPNEEPDKKPGDGTGEEGAAPVLTADPETIVLNAENADKAALTLEWSEAEGTYDLYINLASKDIFTNPYKVEAVSGQSKAFTHEELNDIVIELGAETGTATDIQALLYSDEVQSEKVVVKVTPYEKPFVAPEAIYLKGTSLPWKWGKPDYPQDPPALTASQTDKNIFEAKGYQLKVDQGPSVRAGFKIYFSLDGTDKRVASQDPASDVFGTIKVNAEDVSMEFYPSEHDYTNGVYDIRIDFSTMKLTLTKTGDLPNYTLGDKLYFLGDCLPWKWEWNKDLRYEMAKISEGVYKSQDVEMLFGDAQNPCGFKVFYGYQEWSPYFAQTSDSAKDDIKIMVVGPNPEGDPSFKPGLLGYSDGIYNVEMDFNSMTMRLTCVVSYEGAMRMHGTALPVGWDSMMLLPQKSSNEWELSHVTLNCDGEWNCIKIYPTSEWFPYYGQVDVREGTPEQFGVMYKVVDQADLNAKGDPNFNPGKFGYTSGIYTINVNTETMRLTLTKED